MIKVWELVICEGKLDNKKYRIKGEQNK